MVCDTRLKPRQSISLRKLEVEKAVQRLNSRLMRKQVGIKIDAATGAIAFTGWPEEERDGVTDACAYRRIMATGSALAKAEIAKAELLAGRTVNKQAIAAGVHSHDGGATWGSHK